MTSVPFQVMLNNDNILERDENFTLTIDRRTLPIHVAAINPYQVTVIIIDDETGK